MNNSSEQNIPNVPPVAPAPHHEPKAKSNSYIETLKFALVVIVIFLPIRLFVAKPFIVSGPSMDPTFANGQYLIVDQISYDFEQPKRGDVIIFKYPGDTSKYYIKRIIGLPGDSLTSVAGVITITPKGGAPFVLQQPYIVNKTADSWTAQVPDGSYFVMGDNRPVSFDSRSWGDVASNLIIGKPLIRLFPPSSIGLFPGSTNADETDSASSTSANNR